MSKMEFKKLVDLDVQVITDKAVKVDHPLLEAPIWIPRSTLSMTSDQRLDKYRRDVTELEVDQWFVTRENLEELIQV